MIIDNVRVIERNRHDGKINNHIAATGGWTGDGIAYLRMLRDSKNESCLVYDVTVVVGDITLASEQFVHEFMSKKYPDVEYHLERQIEAFDMPLTKLMEDGKHFVYYYCYSMDEIAIAALEKFVKSKTLMNKINKLDNSKQLACWRVIEENKGEQIRDFILRKKMERYIDQ